MTEKPAFDFNAPYTHPSMPGTSYRPHIQEKPEGIVFPKADDQMVMVTRPQDWAPGARAALYTDAS